MKDILKNVTGIFTGKEEQPNPDVLHNVTLLTQAKTEIDTGVFTRYFKKPFLVAGEVAGYILAVLLLIAGAVFCFQMNGLFELIKTTQEITELLTQKKWDIQTIELLKTFLYILSFSPALLSYLWARSFARARHKISAFMQVESVIDKVIFNLKGAKQ